MSTHVLLHLNLLRTDDDSRAEFYKLMEAEKWVKVHPAFTAWRCSFTGDSERVPEAVIAEIKQLARRAGVPKLYGVAQCGNTRSFDFEYLGGPRLVLSRQ